MKIAIDARGINGKLRHGVFSYTENLINGLSQIDEDNEYFLLFTTLRKKESQMPGPNKNNFKKKILRVPDRDLPFKNTLLTKLVLPYFFKRNRCDIYHAPSGYYLPDRNKTKRILTVHDLRTLKIADSYFPQDIKSLFKSVKSADMCIAVSDTTKKDILGYLNVSSEKIKVIHLGVDDRFKPINKNENGLLTNVRKKYGIEKKYFFSAGGVPRKNVERLIKAFSLFRYKKEFSLIICGAGSNGPWFNRHQDLIYKFGIQNDVKLIGYVSDTDLPLLYSASECFVFPSLYEGFGLPVLEAMRSGTPVITSNVASLPEVGGDAVLYVDPYNEESIANSMERIVEDGQLKQILIDKGIKRAKEFSWGKMAKKTLEIYSELA
ncbi:MAG: hypothetical protein A2166_00405 [Omnitrophica WOR_2 bacterium RBG_13_41_10]|nr:MAG: hypothetical protein A2166_00405 [Omnitrophica WOR_2 bacterium RBG_13_41_10]